VKEKNAKYLPHSAGRYAAKRFRKAQCPIVERLTNSLMMHGRNNGKKLMAVRIVKHAFEIIHLLTGEVSMYTSLVHGFSLAYLTLRMGAACSSETLVDAQWSARRYTAEDRTVHNHCCDSLNSCKLSSVS
jgi:hypothetical protein